MYNVQHIVGYVQGGAYFTHKIRFDLLNSWNSINIASMLKLEHFGS